MKKEIQILIVEDMPADARKLLVDGCADHGHELKNLK